ncbi:AMP-binding protein [Streptantibioticus silvisoli]|uniref:AMP-binding protein n=1 Tax=Streptantibioticus silvisoli TaxID=2705255 RepID=A0ABT6VX49_9ACTN|nr:AMP-binding protein [Streptantibioticus silvisoli]MDI5962312.1 AMP-binding protein [Streptantibioticus silvisoli]
MSYDELSPLDEVADALNADVRVRGFTAVERADGAGPPRAGLDVELERDEPAAELLRRLGPLAARLDATEVVAAGAPGAPDPGPAAARPRGRRQSGVLALIGPPAERADEDRERLSALGHALTRAAAGGNGVTAVDSDGRTLSLTWAELRDHALRHGERLRAAATGPSTRVLLATVEPSATLLAFWACVMADLDPLLVPAELLTADAADVEGWMGALRAELDLALIVRQPDTSAFAGAGWERFATDGTGLETIDPFGAAPAEAGAVAAGRRAAWSREHTAPGAPERTVAFMTSGSTGRPKVVAQRHAAILSVAAGASWMNGLGADDVSLNWMPLSHVGAILMTMVRDVYIGAEHISVATNRILAAPQEWFRIVHERRVTATWSPNFALKLLARTATRVRRERAGACDLSSLRFYLNGGDAVSVADVRDFDERLAPLGLRPGAVTPAWGMTETCSGVTYNTALDTAVTAPSVPSVGFPLPGVELRTVPLDEQEPEGPLIGHLEVRGPSVLERYAAPQDAVGPDRDGWFRTGDLGWISENGLHISGRDEGRIIVNGVNWNTADIESAVDRAPGVAPGTAAAVGHRSGPSGTEDLLVFCAADGQLPPERVPDAVREHLLTVLRLGVRRVVVVDASDIERTGIGKIKKKLLVQRFADAGTPPPAPHPSRSAAPLSAGGTPADFTATGAPATPATSGVRGSRMVWTADVPAKAAGAARAVWLAGPDAGQPDAAAPQDRPADERAGVVLHGDGLHATGDAGCARALLELCERWEPWLDRNVGPLPRTAPVTVLVRDRSAAGAARPLTHPLVSWIRAVLGARGFANVRTLWVAAGVPQHAIRAAVGVADLRDRFIDRDGTWWTRTLLPAVVGTGEPDPGHYVLIGGTGRLGTVLADRLAAGGHRVTVVGRRAVDPGTPGPDRIAGDIGTEQGRDALLRALGSATRPGVPVHLVHLAGSPDLPGASRTRLLEDVVRPKTEGLAHAAVLAERLGAPLTVLSSVNAHLGGAGVPFYAAACAGAEAAAYSRDGVTVIACSRVEHAEHRTGGEDVAALSGIGTVPLTDLVAALTCGRRPATLILGLAARNRYVNEEGACRVRLSAAALEQPVRPAVSLPASPAAGRAGDDTAGRLRGLVDELFPEIDAAADGNWFDLGLTSVNLPLLARRITEEEKVEVSLVDLMRYPSVTALAAVLAERGTATRSAVPGGGER